MKKKNIAIVMGTIYLGGAERALINMLNHFDYERYHVVLWICGEEPGNIALINQNVEIKYVQSEFAVPTENTSPVNPIVIGRRLFSRLLAKLTISDDQKNKHYFAQSLPLLCEQRYDCVIAYRGWDESILRFAFHRLAAKKRIVWMHNDTYDVKFPFPFYYRKADKIYCVSKTIKQHMQELYSGLHGKLEVFYNILDKNDVIRKSEEPCDIPMEHPAILSVGRLSQEKGFDMVPEIAHLLKQKGYHFHWYIIGEGYKRRDIEPRIAQYHVQDCVHLLGAKDNPYPYFKNCDIFVQTSFTEGYCITTAEAKLFYKPVVTTNLPVMYEQFRNHENGIIANELTPASLADAIEELLASPTLCTKLSDELKKENRIISEDLQDLYDYFEK
jgi:glycosyltransferase involved in cell wall biosynthesis